MKFPDPPRGIKALPWRLPIWFYRMGLGWIMGKHFLLLTHTGRRSGKQRQAVIEVIHYDPTQRTYYAVSGFGKKSHWYQNILHKPAVTIQVGNQKMNAFAKQLDPETASQMILDYAHKYPKNLQVLSKMIGYEMEHTPEGYRAFGREIPVIQFSVEHKIERK